MSDFQRRQFQDAFDVVAVGTSVVDPASIAAGAELSGTITVTGAQLGDFVMLAPGVDLQTLLLSYSVIAANTVEWVLLNETVGAIDLASSTWNVYVLRPRAELLAHS